MWIRITDAIIKKVEADHLKNPKDPEKPMVLAFFQRESRSVLHVHQLKKVFPKYYQTPTGGSIPTRKWTHEMEAFAQQELAKLPPQNGRFKITIFGWIMLLFSFSLIGYAVYETATLPAQKEAYAQKNAALASVKEGEIYFGRYRVYQEKGNFTGSEGGFGWFKVVSIENDTYHIAKSVEISTAAKPKEQMNSSDFEEKSFAVKAKELEAYTKQFLSEDGLTEFNLGERKE